VLLVAPEYAGVYELSFVTSGSGESVATTELFVQET
jgi:hypothetical protein